MELLSKKASLLLHEDQNMDNITPEDIEEEEEALNLHDDGLSSSPDRENTPDSVENDLETQYAELQALGISVVDQRSLEERVEAAVDEAVATHTHKQRLQHLRKDIKDIQDDIKEAEKSWHVMKGRLKGMASRFHDPRRYMEIEREMQNKEQQIKTLKTREKAAESKLKLAEVDKTALDDDYLEDGKESQDTEEEEGIEVKKIYSSGEKEKMIQEGQMTPFGTIIKAGLRINGAMPNSEPSKLRQLLEQKKEKKETKPLLSSRSYVPLQKPGNLSRSKSSSSGEVTEFEKYLQDQLNRQKTNIPSEKKGNKRPNGDPKYGIARKKQKRPKEFIGSSVIQENEENLKAKIESKILTKSGIKKAIKSELKKKRDKSKKSENKITKDKNKSPKNKSPKDSNKKRTLGRKKADLEILDVSFDYLPERRRKTTDMPKYTEVDEEEHNFVIEDSEGGGESDYVPSGESDDNYDEDVEEEEEPELDVELENVIKVKKHKKKRKITKEIKSAEEYEAKPMKKKKGKEKDDGDIELYAERINRWKEETLRTKHEKILRGDDVDMEEEEEYEKFDGGFMIPSSVWNKLYKYQKTGVHWLWELFCQECGGILGDEMGLGKTIQIITFLVGLSCSGIMSRYHGYRGLGPVLIVCPATVMHQWVKEFHRWWPPFRVAVLHESGSFNGKKSALIYNMYKAKGILITSYTSVRGNLKTLLNYNWHYVILDEGHKIRNPEAQITMAIKQLQTPYRLILSGSPIQNSLKELWSLFDFIFPGKLGTLVVFLQQFAVPITQGGYANASKLEVQTGYRCAAVLRDTIKPYLLRRMKNDVRPHLNLPDKNEQVLFCSLTEDQRRVYRQYLDGEEVRRIVNGRMKAFVGLINLRKICNHPDLYAKVTEEPSTSHVSGLQPELSYGWWERSGKMQVLNSILRLWRKQDHRVLLFTQAKQMMLILEKFILDQDYSYLKMDGTTTVSSRQGLVDKFNSNPSYFVFLMTTRVGGLGLNLTGADRVIIFDPDWNPSTDIQARERAWRIGQLRHVTIYRLLTAGTIEEKIYHRQIFKQFLTNRVLKDPKQQRFFKNNDLFELFTLNEGNKEKTESSALFAGTGSEIKPKTKGTDADIESDVDEAEDPKDKSNKNSLVNRDRKNIPEYKIRKNVSEDVNEKNVQENKDRNDEEENMKETENGMNIKKKDFDILKPEETQTVKPSEEKVSSLSQDNDKLERMRQLAKLLSKKIVSNPKADGEENKVEKCKDEGMEGSENRTVNFVLENQKHKLGKMHSPSKSTDQERKDKAEKKVKNESYDPEYEKRKKEKKKSKKDKNKKGKKFEGERIEYLVKKRHLKKTEEEEKAERENSKKQDEYILQSLFKKSNICTALSHDVIVNASDQDYLIIEGEADRVAKEALKAVRQSRMLNYPQGTRQPKKRPKFGHKKNHVFADEPTVENKVEEKKCKKNKSKRMEESEESDEADKAVEGITFKKVKGSQSGSTSGVLTSSQLLARMKQRNSGITTGSDSESSDEESAYPSLAAQREPDPVDEETEGNIDLLTDIRNFVAFQAEVDGEAGTQEIVDRFRDRLPKDQTAVFKALLNQICDFHRNSSGKGIWKIKEEFR